MNKSKDYKIEIHSINNEIIVNIDNNPTKVFLQRGFYYRDAANNKKDNGPVTPFAPHIHNYAEIHFFLGDDCSFLIDERDITVSSGTMVSIPKNMYHVPRISNGTQHCAFQIDLPISEFKSVNISTGLIEEFFKEINNLENSNDHSRIASYISLFASFFIKAKKLHANRSTDYGFIIDSFLGLNYSKPIHLADLAEELHISTKQAERLVVLHTGCTFNTALTNNRIRAAEHLMKTTSLSISEIANLVGYESHSGFWKAYKRYREQRKS
ncbi:MAG: helix-turn-helix domain-containing protein [Clostridia bacterium]|nr:helix-turn-helix domain-containing protein [Clostridia bacterium]